MINITTFVERINALTRDYQSGFDSQEELNGYIDQAQLELQQYLLSIYEVNKKAVSYLQPFVVSANKTSDTTGKITLDSNCNQILRMSLITNSNGTRKSIKYIGTNQVDVVYKIPQRRPNLSKGILYYTYVNNGLQLYPEVPLSCEMVYCKYPDKAKIVYTYVSTNNEDKKVIDTVNSKDLLWGERCMNLLIYMVLDKKGLAVRENLFIEFSQLGIAKERITPNN